MKHLFKALPALALAGLLSLALLAGAVYGWLAVAEACGWVEAGTADLVVYRLVETSGTVDPSKKPIGQARSIDETC